MLQPALPILMLAAARLMLPEGVFAPGEGRVAVGAGLAGRAPALDVRLGLLDRMALTVEGIWHPAAPRLGLQLRGAAGNTGHGLFAVAFAEGHLRPVLTSEISESLAGGDLGLGLGLVAQGELFSVGLDGGLALGLPVPSTQAPSGLAASDPTAIDQQGGFFGLERATVGVALGDHFGVQATLALALPIDTVSFRRRNEDVIGRWDYQVGGRVVLRF